MGNAPRVDGLDFGGMDLFEQRAVVIDWDQDFPLGERWETWSIDSHDGPNGWVRRDWLQEVEQGFQFGDEIAIGGFNCAADCLCRFGIDLERDSNHSWSA
jgi:hypothetical protein